MSREAPPSKRKLGFGHHQRSRMGWGMMGLAIGVWTTALWASQPLPEGLTLTDISIRPVRWCHGVIDNRFLIANPTAYTRRVHLALPGHGYSERHGVSELSQTLTVVGKSQVASQLLQPAVNLNGSATYVKVGVNNNVEYVPCDGVNHYGRTRYRRNEWTLNILLSKTLSAEEFKKVVTPVITNQMIGASSNAPIGIGMSPAGNASEPEIRESPLTCEALRFEASGELWPRNWLAYTPFDGCIITADDYAELSAEVRHALRCYVMAGGHLLLLGMAQLPSEWQNNFGLGKAECLNATTFTDQQYVTQCEHMVQAWREVLIPWVSLHEARHHWLDAIPVVSDIRIPARSLLLILLMFTLLVGPGAIFFTIWKARRIWLLWLVPLLSTLFSLLIIGYGVVQDGILPKQRRLAVTLLDQARQCATTLGAWGVYAPLFLQDGIHFDQGTEVMPISSMNSGRIVMGQTQHYVRGWTQPRSPTFFHLRRSESRVERLIVNPVVGEAPEVVNALGAPILRLRLTGIDGQIYETQNLAPGEKAKLQAVDPPAQGVVAMQEFLAHFYSNKAAPGWRITAVYQQMLEATVWFKPDPGHYLVALEGAPFMENPLSYCRTRDVAQSLVIGRFSDAP